MCVYINEKVIWIIINEYISTKGTRSWPCIIKLHMHTNMLIVGMDLPWSHCTTDQWSFRWRNNERLSLLFTFFQNDITPFVKNCPHMTWHQDSSFNLISMYICIFIYKDIYDHHQSPVVLAWTSTVHILSNLIRCKWY